MRQLNWQDLVLEEEPLAKKTFYRIAGKAQYYSEVQSVDEIEFLLDEARRRDIPWRIMGSGTNLVIQSGLLQGLTLKLSREGFNHIRQEDAIFEVGTSTLYPSLVRQAVEAGYEGAASLGGIPGTVGGALIMNAGGHHGEIGDFVTEVMGFDVKGHKKTWSNQDCAFSYRHSNLKGNLLISCRLDFGDCGDNAKEAYSDWLTWKNKSQPTGLRSAGCMFKNPEGHSAGALIDQSGFKGSRKGDIEVSERHANFLLNHGQGCFEDVKDLLEEIKTKVLQDHGVELEAEVEIWENVP